MTLLQNCSLGANNGSQQQCVEFDIRTNGTNYSRMDKQNISHQGYRSQILLGPFWNILSQMPSIVAFVGLEIVFLQAKIWKKSYESSYFTFKKWKQ